MADFLVLINQLISKFNISIAGILGDIFPTIVSRVFQLLPSDAFSFDPGYNTEVFLYFLIIGFEHLLIQLKTSLALNLVFPWQGHELYFRW